ncbi:signal-induced proliferation-associated 1-like protein 1 isoform X1 [Anthonomus grandis grandis]|uniref:signal-induced proliferation-associated 1-like protein 1 isoform X1 n=1 Tax=Anthonomus grandis grandis TaxID=2921223 RepID=UPI002165219C|nr:signal-induced proliferation-associated 1-like protein 1 isoform X1 [Anthonomus grandis grandis]
MIGLQECGPVPPRAPLSTNRVRERTAQAVDYYNTHVHRAWANAGLSASRSSFNDRHGSERKKPTPIISEVLCRSNSSLELLDQNGKPFKSSSPTLRREYGSHGSIDVIDRPVVGVPGKNEFFEMLQDYRPAVLGGTDQRSPGPSEYLRGKVDSEEVVDGNSHGGNYPQSPKVKSKLTRFWGNNTSISNGVTSTNMIKSTRQTMDDSIVSTASSQSVFSQESEEISRRRAFAHYDCQSLTTNLNYSIRLRRNHLAKRRNTTTGASAASMLLKSSTPDGDAEDDVGDGQSNELVESCPFFRNEIGGEEERIVSLTRLQNGVKSHRKPLHKPQLAYGVSILEYPPGETHWRHSTCPYQKFPRPIENVDQGALYYRKYFAGHDHQNWFGMDEQLGPIAISIKREKVIHPENQLTTTLTQYQYRLVIRTSELQTLRGAVLEDAIPNVKASNSPKTLNTKEVLEYVTPEIQLSCLRLGLNNQTTVDQLLKLDEQGLTNNYKVGIMYCKAGQSTEEEMYNNQDAGPAFTEFLETIGKKVKLQGFDKYKAGLDTKADSTGFYSVYAQYQECEIMFHVSTMLPFTPNNRQQLLRKRHIGNDIVTIVFQEPGALPFTPKGIRSQFQHVFIVVNAINPCTENTHYKVAVSRSKEVEVFGPPIKEGAIFPKGKTFAEFLLAKIVNAENAAHRSEKFVTMATRTRQEYLKDLVSHHSSNTPVDTGQKFCYVTAIFSSKKKDKVRPRFIPDLCQRGAILWQVLLDDSGQGQQIECFLGISSDTFVLIEEQSRQIAFVTPCKSILGWSLQTNSLRIYHHQGECMTIHMRDSHGETDELVEIMARLEAVTSGLKAKEFSISRNIMGQLGFHVQPDGIVTLVENQGQAWQAGLRQNSRLVEICKVAVATLTYDQMVDLLKTSLTVTLTVIPCLQDGSPRKGCTLQNCKYNETNYEGDYESMATNLQEENSRRPPQIQQAVSGNHRKIYERSFSPPRSSNSSGYGTGSSSKSFHREEERFHSNGVEGIMPGSSSAYSSDDKWYEIMQDLEPPPVPTKPCNPRTPQHSNNTFPCSPKRSNHHQTIVQLPPTSHNHYTVQHNKIHFTNSLPLQHVNFQQPLSAALHGNNSELDLTREIYKSEKNNIMKQHNERLRQQDNADYLQVTRPPKVAEYQTSHEGDYSRINLNDNVSHDSSISDRINLLGSEDELSTGSGGHSPRSRRPVHQPSNHNQRTQSPRSLNGEAKLRPGVSSRSAANRNSANLSSNFQEELLRLINPDNININSESTNEELFKINGKTGGSSSSRENLMKSTKNSYSSSSRENLNLNGLSVAHSKNQPEVILTMARPATVISNASTNSSPLPGEFRVTKDDTLPSPSKNKVGIPFTDSMPLNEDNDWPSLVANFNRVMSTQINGDDEKVGSKRCWDDELLGTQRLDSHLSSSYSIPDQTKQVAELSRKIQTLERENRRLRDENKKVKEQAQAAVQQLRKFTEWFFKNVKRQ